MKKFIIITSIFYPTEAIKKFSELKDWQLIIVGDRKTPADWKMPGVIYLSPEDQNKLPYKILDHLPWNHYCRKMLGYLYAMKEGADVIADTDDDNIPYAHWGDVSFSGIYKTVSSSLDFVNVYSYFTSNKVWPRGFPLKLINADPQLKEAAHEQQVGIWQYLADKEPDVDAIYRLVIGDEVYFDKNKPLVLEKGTLSPFNSQNTFFKKELFPLLYLPAFVTFRFTDILRGLIAQPILWQQDYKLAFGPATVYQERNEHDFLKDFESEVPVYLFSEKIPGLIKERLSEQQDIYQALVAAYEVLLEEGIVTAPEITLLKAWLSDIKAINK